MYHYNTITMYMIIFHILFIYCLRLYFLLIFIIIIFLLYDIIKGNEDGEGNGKKGWGDDDLDISDDEDDKEATRRNAELGHLFLFIVMIFLH